MAYIVGGTTSFSSQTSSTFVGGITTGTLSSQTATPVFLPDGADDRVMRNLLEEISVKLDDLLTIEQNRQDAANSGNYQYSRS